MSNVMEVLMDKFGTSRRGLELMNKYVLYTTGKLSITESEAFMVPYAKWRVRACGYLCVTNGGTDEGVMSYGLLLSDAGAADADAFGSLTEHTGFDVDGDMYVKDMSSVLPAFEALTVAADVPTWAAGGALLDVWQTKAGAIEMAASSAGAATWDAIGFMLLEVG